MLLATEADPEDQPALTMEDGSFLTDVLELGLEETAASAARLCSVAEFQSLLTWISKNLQQDTGIGLPWPTAFEATTEHEATSLQGCTSCKTHEGNRTTATRYRVVCTLEDQRQAFVPLVRYLRQKYLPYQHFTGCSILRGAFGYRPCCNCTSLQLCSCGNNSSTNQFYVSSVAALSFPPDTFSIQEWSVVTFWDEQTTTNKPDPGPDREDMETEQPSGQPPSGAPPTTGPAPTPSQPVYADPNVPMSPVHSDEDMPNEPPSGPSPSPGFEFPTPEVHMPQTIAHSLPILPQPPEKRVRFGPKKEEKQPLLRPGPLKSAVKPQQVTTSKPEEQPVPADTDSDKPHAEASSSQQRRPILLVDGPGDQQSDEDDDNDTLPYDDSDSRSLVVWYSDEPWHDLEDVQKMCAFTSSFTVPHLADGPLDVDNVMSVLAVKKLSPAARAKARKEATTTDLRKYATKFAEAKRAEYESWRRHDAFDLVDTRTLSVKNYVTGRWVLTVKHDKMATSQGAVGYQRFPRQAKVGPTN